MRQLAGYLVAAGLNISLGGKRARKAKWRILVGARPRPAWQCAVMGRKAVMMK